MSFLSTPNLLSTTSSVVSPLSSCTYQNYKTNISTDFKPFNRKVTNLHVSEVLAQVPLAGERVGENHPVSVDYRARDVVVRLRSSRGFDEHLRGWWGNGDYRGKAVGFRFGFGFDLGLRLEPHFLVLFFGGIVERSRCFFRRIVEGSGCNSDNYRRRDRDAVVGRCDGFFFFLDRVLVWRALALVSTTAIMNICFLTV